MNLSIHIDRCQTHTCQIYLSDEDLKFVRLYGGDINANHIFDPNIEFDLKCTHANNSVYIVVVAQKMGHKSEHLLT